jgi:hypothetical protein
MENLVETMRENGDYIGEDKPKKVKAKPKTKPAQAPLAKRVK